MRPADHGRTITRCTACGTWMPSPSGPIVEDKYGRFVARHTKLGHRLEQAVQRPEKWRVLRGGASAAVTSAA